MGVPDPNFRRGTDTFFGFEKKNQVFSKFCELVLLVSQTIYDRSQQLSLSEVDGSEKVETSFHFQLNDNDP